MCQKILSIVFTCYLKDCNASTYLDPMPMVKSIPGKKNFPERHLLTCRDVHEPFSQFSVFKVSLIKPQLLISTLKKTSAFNINP